jgi:hypothetical protein
MSMSGDEQDMMGGQSETGTFIGQRLVEPVPIVNSYGTEMTFTPPPRPAADPNFAPSGWSPKNRYDQYTYTGPGLVDGNGLVRMFDQNGQPRYYNRGDASQYYYNLPPAQRALIVNVMGRKGYSVGTPERDMNAIWDLMLASNNLGRTLDVTLTQLDKIAPDVAEKVAAPRYRVSAAADLRTVANQVAMRTLGREFTADESARFVQSYQQAEMGFQQAGAGVVEQPAAVDVAAEQFAQQVAPTEANAYAYLGAVDRLMKSVGRI